MKILLYVSLDEEIPLNFGSHSDLESGLWWIWTRFALVEVWLIQCSCHH